MLRYLRRLAILRRDRGIVEVRRQGLRWQLDLSHFLDRAIYTKGMFEHRATRLVRNLVREGMRVLDVGANFGYYTTILAADGGAGKSYLAIYLALCVCLGLPFFSPIDNIPS